MINRWTLLGTIAVAGLLAAYVSAQRAAEFSIERLADNLVVIRDSEDGNTAVFVRPDGVVLVDTKSLKAGQRLLETVRSISDKPVTHILHTHHHYDHVGGNSYFPSHVEVVAHETAARRMTTMEEFAPAERKHGLADRTFKDKLTLFSGQDAIDMYYFGAAHTDGDAFIVFRGLGIMHSGDTFPGLSPVVRDGGSAEAYPATMNRAASEINGVRTVIPGHGPIKTWQDFVDNAAKLRNK